MTTFSDNIKKRRIELGYSQKDIADKIGAAKSTYSLYESGNREPGVPIIKKISNVLDISVDRLLGINELAELVTRRVPLLGEIACGQPIYANEERELWAEVGSKIKADFCLKAKGDSMINARIQDGDIVFIKKQDMIDNGEIGAIIIDDAVTLKRVFYNPTEKKMVLQAENPRFEPLVYIGEELDHIHILGKAVAFQSNLR